MSERQIGLPGDSEDMVLFFDTRASSYERHMQENVEDFAAFYHSMAAALPELGESPRILDLGIGTGLELDSLFERFPKASVTGIDLSSAMLDELSRKPRLWISQVELLAGSFMEVDLGQSTYDAVISSMALHHWTPQVKLELYQRIHDSLRPGGSFVNGDYVESEAESHRRLAEFGSSGINERHRLHIDLPLSPKQESELLARAGYLGIRTPFVRTNVCVFAASTG
ncbi:class I SAM-dependent methyltransferase [Candidatus Bipolaricaulota bacterium]